MEQKTTIANEVAPAASTSASTAGRNVARKLKAREMQEGEGARVKRSIGLPQLDVLDPFLLLDEFFVQPPAGFPEHPHRGFETVTYMIDGSFTHRDNKGHAGTIGPGSLQWMTAGRGILHSEMPGTADVNHGLQLWVNLAAKDKMCDPEYQELSGDKVPEATQGGVHVKVIAGESLGKKADIRTRTPAIYLYFKIAAGTTFEQPIPAELKTAFAYVLSGEGEFGDDATAGAPSECLILNQEGTGLKVKAKTDLHFALIAGKPIGQPVARYGPFVMNTREEIQQALRDLQLNRF